MANENGIHTIIHLSIQLLHSWPEVEKSTLGLNCCKCCASTDKKMEARRAQPDLSNKLNAAC